MSEETKFKSREMFATTAIHKLGDISREDGDFCYVEREDADNYYGSWLEGFGFFAVRFPKATTRELTPDELEKQSKKEYVIV